jgi:hypothetical protein
MKVFLSHQQADSVLADQIAQRLLLTHSIQSYLDVIDPYLGGGDTLADHVRTEMGKCTQLLAVVSRATQHSQWVPWEIGVATEKDFPLATYSSDSSLPPEFLRKWPYLRSTADLDAYARESKKTDSTYQIRKSYITEQTARRQTTGDFYRSLRASLGQ